MTQRGLVLMCGVCWLIGAIACDANDRDSTHVDALEDAGRTQHVAAKNTGVEPVAEMPVAQTPGGDMPGGDTTDFGSGSVARKDAGTDASARDEDAGAASRRVTYGDGGVPDDGAGSSTP